MFNGWTHENIAHQMKPRALARFRLAVNAAEVSTLGCIVWPRGVSKAGYGRFNINGIAAYAHRIVWELSTGPIPQRMTIDHLCLNRRCINVAHMEVVTLSENCRRARLNDPPRTHCVKGHEFTEPQVRGQRRTCLACNGGMRRVTRMPHGSSHCGRGHAFTDANAYIRRNGFRSCKECQRLRFLAYCSRHRSGKEKTAGQLLQQ